MSVVHAALSVSLDGYSAGPDDGPHNPLGDGGERLHEWMFPSAAWRETHQQEGGESGPDDEVIREWTSRSGSHVMGRRMFDNGEEPWGPEPPFGKPVFVVTSRPRETLVKGATTFTFVTDGVERAVDLAREAAGEKDVEVSGGASIVQQLLRAGLLDELEIHVAPLFLGGGVRLLDDLSPGIRLERDRVVDSPRTTHLRYRVVR
jgi:dihydrofolate reductase